VMADPHLRTRRMRSLTGRSLLLLSDGVLCVLVRLGRSRPARGIAQHLWPACSASLECVNFKL
jgi:hypothetical protein